jgi:hypothetical protein
MLASIHPLHCLRSLLINCMARCTRAWARWCPSFHCAVHQPLLLISGAIAPCSARALFTQGSPHACMMSATTALCIGGNALLRKPVQPIDVRMHGANGKSCQRECGLR